MAQPSEPTKGSGGLKNISINKNPKANRLPDKVSSPKQNSLLFPEYLVGDIENNFSLAKHEYINIAPMSNEVVGIVLIAQ